jgi:hypothetical protein
MPRWAIRVAKGCVLSPLADVMRDAGALADRADAGIAVIDVPGLLVAFGSAAAGKGRHDLLIRLAGAAGRGSCRR